MTATANAMGMLKEGTSILQQIKEHGTNVDVTEGLRQIAATATRLMQQLDRIIVGPLSTQEQQALFAQAAPAVPPPGGNNASQSIV
jgi:flagellin-like hook-associated protein FlgL